MSMYTIYKAIISVYTRLNRDTSELALRIGTAYAVGQLTEDQYAELILAVTPATESGETT